MSDTAGVVWLWHTLAMSKDTDKNSGKSEEPKMDDTLPVEEMPAKEIGGRGGLNPTRYGDWEKAGRCVDF